MAIEFPIQDPDDLLREIQRLITDEKEVAKFIPPVNFQNNLNIYRSFFQLVKHLDDRLSNISLVTIDIDGWTFLVPNTNLDIDGGSFTTPYLNLIIDGGYF